MLDYSTDPMPRVSRRILVCKVLFPCDNSLELFWGRKVLEVSSSERLLIGAPVCMQGTPEGVEDNGSLTRVAAFPIGIDPERFAQALEKPNVKAHIAQLLNRYAGRKVLLLPLSAQKGIALVC